MFKFLHYPIFRNKKGLTFFEVMVTVVILSSGIVFIYKALLSSLHYQEYLTHRLYAMNMLTNRLAELQQLSRDKKGLSPSDDAQTKEIWLDHKKIEFTTFTRIRPVGGQEDVFQVDVELSWVENDRTVRLPKSILLVQDGIREE